MMVLLHVAAKYSAPAAWVTSRGYKQPRHDLVANYPWILSIGYIPSFVSGTISRVNLLTRIIINLVR
jgi:hypothetical protein